MKVNVECNIVTAADRNYLQPLSVMLYSLASSMKNNFNVYILTRDIGKEDVNYLKNLCAKSNIYLVCVDEFEIPDVSHELRGRISKATYFRLLIPFLNEFKKIYNLIYVDPDVLIKKSFETLVTHDLNGNIFGAVKDAPLVNRNRENSWGEHDYFNAGMLLINLDLLRKKYEKLKDLDIDLFDGKYEFNDQDILNRIVSEVHWLDDKYNYQTVQVENDLIKNKVLKDPCIVHFTGADKPWYLHSNHYFKSEYLEVAHKLNYFPVNDLFVDDWDLLNLEKLKGFNGSVVIYGAGERGRRQYLFIQRNFLDVNVVCFVDSKISKQHKFMMGLEVIEQYNVGIEGKILISSKEFKLEIMQELKLKLNSVELIEMVF